MTDTSNNDKATQQRRTSLAKARQVLANQRAEERERIFAKSGDHPVAKQPATTSEFEGLTTTECCDDCNKDRCIISGKFYCAHPMKSGLQHGEKNDHESLKRFKRAKAVLNGAKLNLQAMSE